MALYTRNQDHCGYICKWHIVIEGDSRHPALCKRKPRYTNWGLVSAHQPQTDLLCKTCYAKLIDEADNAA